MGNKNVLNPKVSRSLLLWWVLANVLGLPVLLITFGWAQDVFLGVFLDASSDLSTYVSGFILVSMILALCGFIIGGWLGLTQWLVLRKQFQRAGRWILASSIGTAIGWPLGCLVYTLFIANRIIYRHGGIYIYISEWNAYMAFWVSLGLSIGISQWLVLKRWVDKATWWIVTLPLCFALGIAFTNNRSSLKAISQFVPRTVAHLPALPGVHTQIEYPAILLAFTALVIVSLVTGVLLDRLLRFHNKQKEEQ